MWSPWSGLDFQIATYETCYCCYLLYLISKYTNVYVLQFQVMYIASCFIWFIRQFDILITPVQYGNQCRFFCRLDALPVTSQTASDLRSPQYNMSFIWHPYGMWHVGVPGADVQVAVGHAQFESVHCWTEADVTSGHCVRCHWECRRA